MTRLILFIALAILSGAARAESIDLNSAPVEALEALPGIGPAKARAIVADREKNGPFASVEELDRVRGFGVKAIDRLRPFLSVNASGGARTRAEASTKSDGSRAAPQASPPKAAAKAAWDPELDALDKESPDGKVNLNVANEATLRAINGLSAPQAKVIVAVRREKGPFRHLGELSRVPGLTPKLLDTMKYFVTIRLDANKATADELAACGISPDDARAFVAARQRKGKLKQAGEVGKLAGLSAEAAREIKHWLWFP